MAYIKDRTQFRHNAYGTGVFRGYGDNGILLIEFAGLGMKKFLDSSIRNGLLTEIAPIVETPQSVVATVVHESVAPIVAPTVLPSGVVQYDSSDTVVGDRNILEAFDCEEDVIFNESYVVVGNDTHAHTVRATYDLTILGNLSVDEISVNGILTVMGDVQAKKINCANALICHGNITADDIYIGGDLIADSVKCSDFLCDGNAIIRTTIDIEKSSRIEKTMVACEGIIGGGTFAAMNAIANEYFVFDGDVEGHILELATDTTFSDISKPTTTISMNELPIDDALTQIAERIRLEYSRIGELDEEALLELMSKLSSGALAELEDIGFLFEQLTQISYKDEIDDLGDYLVIEYAKKKLPSQLYHYEAVEHIDSILLPQAQAGLEEMEFVPSSVEKIAQSLRIIVRMHGELPLSTDALCDKVFSSVGLRFSTVKGIMSRTGIARPTAPASP